MEGEITLALRDRAALVEVVREANIITLDREAVGLQIQVADQVERGRLVLRIAVVLELL